MTIGSWLHVLSTCPKTPSSESTFNLKQYSEMEDLPLYLLIQFIVMAILGEVAVQFAQNNRERATEIVFLEYLLETNRNSLRS